MLNKLLLTSILPFVSLDGQMPFGMATIMSFSIIILLMKPYIRKGDDRLHLLVNTEIFLYLLSAHVIQSSNKFLTIT